MATWVFCNCCFQPPRRKSFFSLTNCGHVYCDACLGKGKKDECLICKTPCHTVLLSKHTDSDIQAFFMRIDGLCNKYSQETSQISEFQEKHRRRLLAFYREKISQLEESLRKTVLQIERLQRRSSQPTAFATGRSSVSTRPDERLLVPPDSSAPGRVEQMEVDLTPPPARKPEAAVGPARISVISPPQDGRMGSVSFRGPQHLSLTPSHTSAAKPLRVPPPQMPYRRPSPAPASQFPGRAGQGASPGLSSSQAGPPRQPISIAGLLQRPRPGATRRPPGGQPPFQAKPSLEAADGVRQSKRRARGHMASMLDTRAERPAPRAPMAWVRRPLPSTASAAPAQSLGGDR